MCLMCRWMTAYSMTDITFRSVLGTMLAMLRWMKTSPASRPMISFAGTRLSEHPMYLRSCQLPCLVIIPAMEVEDYSRWRVLTDSQDVDQKRAFRRIVGRQRVLPQSTSCCWRRSCRGSAGGTARGCSDRASGYCLSP